MLKIKKITKNKCKEMIFKAFYKLCQFTVFLFFESYYFAFDFDFPGVLGSFETYFWADLS